MFGVPLLVPLLVGCTGPKSDDTAVAVIPPPTITWLTPSDGETVTAGDVACSLIVADFTLQDPAKHNEGQPIGYVDVTVDGTDTLQSGSTTFSLTLAAGTHTLDATLLYVDGDGVSASSTALCDEDATTGGCGPVEAAITVTAE